MFDRWLSEKGLFLIWYIRKRQIIEKYSFFSNGVDKFVIKDPNNDASH